MSRRALGHGRSRCSLQYCRCTTAGSRYLEGQVALLRHVMAFKEANSGRKVLSDKQRWKATFAAYFLGAMSQGQLALLEQTTNDAAGVAYASPNSWVVKTSKSLSYELRHNSNRSLSAERRAVREPADAAGFQVDAGEDPCVSSE